LSSQNDDLDVLTSPSKITHIGFGLGTVFAVAVEVSVAIVVVFADDRRFLGAHPVDRCGRLHDDALYLLGPLCRGQKLKRPDYVVLLHLGTAPEPAGMRRDVGVDQRVDLVRIDDAGDQGVANIGADEFELVDGNRWLTQVHADNSFDFVIVLESLRDSQAQ
jgi:hypothetical protein